MSSLDRVIFQDDKDRVVRAIANDGSFRLIAARATGLVKSAADMQGVTGIEAGLFAELLMGSLLIRETMAPGLRVQAVLRCQGNIIADSHPSGMTRGLFQRPESGEVLSLTADSHFQVMRVLPRGKMHQGIVKVDPEEGVSGALAEYLFQSEQVESRVGVHCVVENGEIVSAGGYIIQRLPEAVDEVINAMIAREAQFEAFKTELVARDADPEWMVAELFGEEPYTMLSSSPVFSGCNCGQERVMGALATLSRDDLQDIVNDGEALSMTCDYCNSTHSVGVELLRAMLADN